MDSRKSGGWLKSKAGSWQWAWLAAQHPNAADGRIMADSVHPLLANSLAQWGQPQFASFGKAPLRVSIMAARPSSPQTALRHHLPVHPPKCTPPAHWHFIS